METCPDSTHRDMSLWHVTVPYVITKQDSNSKPYPVFNILVAEIGTKGKNKVLWFFFLTSYLTNSVISLVIPGLRAQGFDNNPSLFRPIRSPLPQIQKLEAYII